MATAKKKSGSDTTEAGSRSRNGEARKSEFWPDVAAFLKERETVMLRQILMDASIRTSAYRTANTVLLTVNFEAGFAEISNTKVATAFGVSNDTVGRDLKDLERAGHFEIQWGEGSHGVHRVRWILKPETRFGAFHGLERENIVKSKTKAGGHRNRSANLRTLEDEQTSANLRMDAPQNCGGKVRKFADHTIQGNKQGNQDGGRALRRASANTYGGVVDDVVLVDENEDQTLDQTRAGSPHCGATVAPAAEPNDPDAWRSAAEFQTSASDLGAPEARRWDAKNVHVAGQLAPPDPLAELQSMGIIGETLDVLRDTMAGAAADGVRHVLSAPELAAAVILGFCHRDQVRAKRAATDVRDVLTRLAKIALIDDSTRPPSEYAADLFRGLRQLARKAHQRRDGEVEPDEAIATLAVAVGFPDAAPAAPAPLIHAEVQTPTHSASHATDRVADVFRRAKLTP